MLNCQACNQEFPETAAFCPFCGTASVDVADSRTMLGGIRAEDVVGVSLDETSEVDDEWETMLGGFSADDAVVAGPLPDSIQSQPSKQIVHETVIIDETLDATTNDDPPINRTMVNALVREPSEHDTIAMVSLDDVEFGQNYGVKLMLSAGLVATIITGALFGLWLHENVDMTSEAAVAEVTAPAVEEVVEEPAPRPVARLRVLTEEKSFDILRGAEVLHTVSTVKGSRYDKLSERARSVTVRLDHVAEKTGGRFAARPSGKHYEVVFSEEGSDFRIMDVTRADAKSVDSEIDLLANLLVDRLNADLPTAGPNS